MTKQEKIATWGEGDSIIQAQRCETLGCIEDHPRCELCGTKLTPCPESVERCKRPDFHLLCPACINVVRAAGHDILFKGRYDTSKGARASLPADGSQS